ncbi:hypothetical protein P8C59_005754 [Phyllachora maydis]|uniref:Uncharacterized protein n=1 Tax=Phyllachora maydis TaxID=1825666 RepID=A0AAD9I619_9PEZI|nr:hypothetical protein P8C59_005754 [Phyllachora maydis]
MTPSMAATLHFLLICVLPASSFALHLPPTSTSLPPSTTGSSTLFYGPFHPLGTPLPPPVAARAQNQLARGAALPKRQLLPGLQDKVPSKTVPGFEVGDKIGGGLSAPITKRNPEDSTPAASTMAAAASTTTTTTKTGMSPLISTILDDFVSRNTAAASTSSSTSASATKTTSSNSSSNSSSSSSSSSSFTNSTTTQASLVIATAPEVPPKPTSPRTLTSASASTSTSTISTTIPSTRQTATSAPRALITRRATVVMKALAFALPAPVPAPEAVPDPSASDLGWPPVTVSSDCAALGFDVPGACPSSPSTFATVTHKPKHPHPTTTPAPRERLPTGIYLAEAAPTTPTHASGPSPTTITTARRTKHTPNRHTYKDGAAFERKNKWRKGKKHGAKGHKGLVDRAAEAAGVRDGDGVAGAWPRPHPKHKPNRHTYKDGAAFERKNKWRKGKKHGAKGHKGLVDRDEALAT